MTPKETQGRRAALPDVKSLAAFLGPGTEEAAQVSALSNPESWRQRVTLPQGPRPSPRLENPKPRHFKEIYWGALCTRNKGSFHSTSCVLRIFPARGTETQTFLRLRLADRAGLSECGQRTTGLNTRVETDQGGPQTQQQRPAHPRDRVSAVRKINQQRHTWEGGTRQKPQLCFSFLCSQEGHRTLRALCPRGGSWRSPLAIPTHRADTPGCTGPPIPSCRAQRPTEHPFPGPASRP